jgi:hypothetical protein
MPIIKDPKKRMRIEDCAFYIEYYQLRHLVNNKHYRTLGSGSRLMTNDYT